MRFKVCDKAHFTCTVNGTLSCVEKELVCDDEMHCDSASEEIDVINSECPAFNDNCGIQHFKCHNGKCIDESSHCDGKCDCEDKSDELFCGNAFFQDTKPNVLLKPFYTVIYKI